MKVFIIEDEELGVERLKEQLATIDPDIRVLGSADSISASVAWLQEHESPELIFMDIELADGQSFEIFRQVPLTCPVIFTTSYDEYMLQAFKVNSLDYLLKPIKNEELEGSLRKYREVQQQYLKSLPIDVESLLQALKQPSPSYRNRFLVKQGQRLISVETKEIAYFFIDGRYTCLKTWNGGKHYVEYTLDELEKALDAQVFRRINRSFIVHSKAIARIQTYFTGKLKLELTPAADKEVNVSRENSSAFKKWMGL
ncbi:MAG TPA: LytTR family DNA-binding domain-containing protein [Chitinophagaceae bacterium]|jgi:DNA-binding LytR/AlgR family response regulator|nr:LytTR family DNA-binding domain-containing protein [Chitinophagaceae bacterium]